MWFPFVIGVSTEGVRYFLTPENMELPWNSQSLTSSISSSSLSLSLLKCTKNTYIEGRGRQNPRDHNGALAGARESGAPKICRAANLDKGDSLSGPCIPPLNWGKHQHKFQLISHCRGLRDRKGPGGSTKQGRSLPVEAKTLYKDGIGEVIKI